MIKRRSAKEVIESTKSPELEHSFLKYARGEPLEVTADGNTKTSSGVDHFKSIDITDAEENYDRRYMQIHTHPTEVDGKVRNSVIPSGPDLKNFLLEKDKLNRTRAIATREPDTGKVRGYTVIRKTNNTPRVGFFDELKSLIGKGLLSQIKRDTKEYSHLMSEYRAQGRLDLMYKTFENFAEKYQLNYKLKASEGYTLSDAKTRFEKKKNLEGIALTAMFGLLGAIFIFYSNFTGNVIGNNVNSNSNLIGMVLFIVGIVGTFIYFKKN